MLGALAAGSVAAAGPEPVRAVPVTAPEGAAGRLAYRGGFALQSDDERFGGFSALHWDAEGGAAVAISDRGFWTSWRLMLEADTATRLAGVEALHPMRPLLGPDGGRVRMPYNDSEAVARLPDGTFVVAFESVNRLWRYEGGLGGVVMAMAAPEGLSRLPTNQGLEALTAFADGRLLAIAEGGERGVWLPAWLRDAGGDWHRLRYRRTAPFRPTAAATLPGGDVVVLERRFSVFEGFASRLVRLAAADIRPGADLVGDELGRLERPWPTENFEGLAVHSQKNETILLLISDDNYNFFQRTLLLAFSILPPME